MKNLVIVVVGLFIFIVGCYGDNGNGGDNIDADSLIPGAGVEDYTAQDYELEFKLWEQHQTPFADADKTGQGDANMCWAAVAANLLAWVGWAADEDDTFGIFKDHFEDKAGYVYDALRYYFTNYIPGVGAEMVTVRESRSPQLLDFIVSAVHEGKGVAVKIAYPGKEIGHFLSIYGYRYIEEEDNFMLYFTDSDDGLHQMRQFKVEWNDDNERWETRYLYRGYYLAYAITLARG
jgi:hypothetical protein